MEVKSWEKFREVAFSSLIGSHMDPKKLPKTAEKYLPLTTPQDTTELDRDAMKRELMEMQEIELQEQERKKHK
tara:strand:- start:141 stop:359 length:219 start_codon:yes stop_codon:yes gene_type:complete